MFVNWSTYLRVWVKSLESFPPRSKIRAEWKRTPAIARTLHATFNEAVASGDPETVARIGAPDMAREFSSIASKNQRTSTLRWEVLDYKSSPKLVSKIFYLFDDNKMWTTVAMKPPISQQAVVRIRSTQRLAKWKPKATPSSSGKPTQEIVQGSEKILNLDEYVVIVRLLDQTDYIPWGDWKLAAIIRPATVPPVEKIVALETKFKRNLEEQARKNLESMGLKPDK